MVENGSSHSFFHGLCGFHPNFGFDLPGLFIKYVRLFNYMQSFHEKYYVADRTVVDFKKSLERMNKNMEYHRFTAAVF